MTLTIFSSLAGGLVVLTLGAELLVRGASRLASFFGMSSLVIGLTVVAFGTSAPELAVSMGSALGGKADIAIGNVVGSNICNVLLILGLSALIVPLTVQQQLIRLDVPILIGISALVYVFGLDGALSFIEGAILFAGLIAYLIFLLKLQKKEQQAVVDEYKEAFGPQSKLSSRQALWNGMLVALGLAMLLAGAHFFVSGAVQFARNLGVSELLIGLTIVAVGTSLPEIATSIMAAIKGERDIAVGNVIGSNIFNILAVLGLSAVVAPGGVGVSQDALAFDIPVMLAVALLCFPIFLTGSVISRLEGILFLFLYIAYIAFLILKAQHSDWMGSYSQAFLYGVLPLIIVLLLASVFRHLFFSKVRST